MAKVTVYHFWHYDVSTDESRLSPTKRIAKEIELIGQKPAEDTAQEVDGSELDRQGRYYPRKDDVV